MYHISDLKKFLHCERLYFYNKDENNVFKPYLRSDESVNDLICDYLKADNCFIGVKNDPNDRFFNEEKNFEWFSHPRFCDGEMRINIPFMHKTQKGYDIYFVYYGTILKDLDLITYRISIQVLNKLGLNVNDVYVIYFNGNYINSGQLEIDKLLILTSSYKDENIKDIINSGVCDYESIIEKMNDSSIIDKPAVKCKYCRQNGLCDYYAICFPQENSLENDCVLTLVSSRNKNRMFDEGIRLLKDVDLEQIEGNKVQYAQIMASRNGGIYYDSLALKKWLSKLDTKNMSFVDFEWDRYIVPPYKNMRPLDVLCFEFALYYLDDNNQMQHKTFVGTGDCRQEFIDELISSLPTEGPILAYNADGAEKLRLQELGNMFPEYKQQLDKIVDRFVDLAIPFVDGLIYDVRMKGNYTLKKLVDIVSDYSYKDLDIYDGMEAVFNWRDVDKGTGKEEEIVSNLKEYCSLDAYGLYLVYSWLIRLTKES